MNFDTKPTEAKMQKSIAAYSENLATIRAGRANASVLSEGHRRLLRSGDPINQVAGSEGFRCENPCDTALGRIDS